MPSATANFPANHLVPRITWGAVPYAIVTSDRESTESQRSDIDLTLIRFRPDRWFNIYSFGFESNDQLGLNLRTSLGAGMGRYLIQSNTSELALVGGVVGTSESIAVDSSDSTTDSRQENVDGLLGLQYSHYVYNHPSIDLSGRGR
jgi:hypothetical protein